jgi:eukaryotic-like serine/threonine-protein kinase
VATFCPQCKQRFTEDSGFCPLDGTPLEAANEAPNEAPPDLDDEASALEHAARTDGTDERLTRASQPDEHERLVGTILDQRYHIERMLGQGGMGVVFLARHAVIEKMVAIKVLGREVAHDHAVAERFEQDARAASRIGHPGIVGVIDVGATPEGMTYAVMEYVDGHRLDRVIATHAPMAPSRALSIAIQIARALGAAHDKGVVHRNLKPRNVFILDRDGRDFVKIVDAGMAAMDSGPASARLRRAGPDTPGYMAPELAAGRSDIDHRVDIYSLGIILYEMIVGRVPHKGEHAMGTLAMQMFDPIEPPRKALPGLAIHDELEQVMLTALARNPAQRFATMHELASALERAGESAHQQAPGAVASGAPERRAWQRRWPLLVAALGLLAGGAVTAALLAGGDGTSAAPRTGAASSAPVPAIFRDTAPPVLEAAAAAAIGDAGPSVDAPIRVTAPRDKARGVRPGKESKPGIRRQIDVQVVTIPNFANLYIGNDYSGTSGTTIRRAEGAVVEVECRLEGYVPGRVKVRFDGNQELYECKLTFIERCVDGIKNPFDDCPE